MCRAAIPVPKLALPTAAFALRKDVLQHRVTNRANAADRADRFIHAVRPTTRAATVAIPVRVIIPAAEAGSIVPAALVMQTAHVAAITVPVTISPTLVQTQVGVMGCTATDIAQDPAIPRHRLSVVRAGLQTRGTSVITTPNLATSSAVMQ